MRFNIGPIARGSIPLLAKMDKLAVEAKQRGDLASKARAKATKSQAAVDECAKKLRELQAQATEDNEEATQFEVEAVEANTKHDNFSKMALATLNSNDDDDHIRVKTYELKRDSKNILRFMMMGGLSFATVNVIDGKAHLVVRAEMGTASASITVLHLVVQGMGALEIVHSGGERYLQFKGVRNRDDGMERFLIKTKDPALLDGLFDKLVKLGAKEMSKAKSKSTDAENNDPNKA